jgi:quinol monooxygenase YgiN
MVIVIAQYQAEPGRGDTIAATLRDHVAVTRTEPGCIEFVAHRMSDDPDRFLLYERYVSEEAFEAHRASPHFRAYVEGTIVPNLAERKWSRYEEIEPLP